MKALVLALAAFAFSAHAGPWGPDTACNDGVKREKLQVAVMKNVQDLFNTTHADSSPASFHFIPVSRLKDTSDLAVYFEGVKGEMGEIRQGYIASYSVNLKTCKTTFIKMQSVMPDETGANYFESSSPSPEKCNKADQWPAVHKEVEKTLKNYISQFQPNATLDNFTFSGIQRVPKTADLFVMFEATTKGILTTPMVAQITVDPQTCKIDVRRWSAFNLTVATPQR